MFYIIHSSGLYFHNKGRIILFESQDEAQNFVEMFIQYSTNRIMQENPMEVMQVPITIMRECKIATVDFDINEIKCGTVLAYDLFEEARSKNGK